MFGPVKTEVLFPAGCIALFHPPYYQYSVGRKVNQNIFRSNEIHAKLEFFSLYQTIEFSLNCVTQFNALNPSENCSLELKFYSLLQVVILLFAA